MLVFVPLLFALSVISTHFIRPKSFFKLTNRLWENSTRNRTETNYGRFFLKIYKIAAELGKWWPSIRV